MSNYENDNVFDNSGSDNESRFEFEPAKEPAQDTVTDTGSYFDKTPDGEEPQSIFLQRNAVYGEIEGQANTEPVGYEAQGDDFAEPQPSDDYSSGEESSAYSYDENDVERSDSYYMNRSPYGPRYDESFYQQNSSRKKKKKYISVPAAVVALVVTAVISITGGAALSNVGLFGGGNNGNSSGNYSSVQENINNSASGFGSSAVPEATAIATSGDQPLTTPEIVDKVGPAVVGIVNKTTFADAYGQFGRFYGNLDEEIEQSSGSGVIISSDGYIVTNNHVVENATKINVILNSGDEYEAKIIGRDSSTDLALLKIEASGLTFAQMGTSSNLRVGETAIAIGNPLGQEFAGTTTQGIISGLNRSVTIGDKTLNLIQTDAAINPGNSGGALVNEYGVLIGINTAKISSDTLEGLGFAIPIDEAKPIIQELMTNGYVTGRPVVGIAGRAVTKEDADAYGLKIGVYVSSMTANGPAYMSGMKVGDIIVECEGEPIETVDDINEIKNKKAPGDELKFKVWRKSGYKDLVVILGEEMPAE